MSVVRLTIAYLGTRFCGWQRQPDAPSVQQHLEEALTELCGRPVRAVAAGRTDAGVHAEGQEVHLQALGDQELEDLPTSAWVHGGNKGLPGEIRILRAQRMPDGFDARRSCVAKRYRYRLWHGGVTPPHAALICAPLQPGVDLDRLAEIAPLLQRTADFAAFGKTGGAPSSSVRTVTRCELERFDAQRSDLVVEGPGFLRGMVRAMVGALQEVARGRLQVADLEDLFVGGGARANPHAPAHGLTLEHVRYPIEGDDAHPPPLD